MLPISRKRANNIVMLVSLLGVIILVWMYRDDFARMDRNLVAVVGKNPVTKEEFSSFLREYYPQTTDYEGKKLALDDLVTRELVWQYAQRSGMDESTLKPLFNAMTDFRRDSLLTEMLLAQTPPITDAAVEDYYLHHRLYALYKLEFRGEQAALKQMATEDALRKGKPLADILGHYTDTTESAAIMGVFEGDPDLSDPTASDMAKILKKSGDYTPAFGMGGATAIIYRLDKPPVGLSYEYISKKLQDQNRRIRLSDLQDQIATRLRYNKDLAPQLAGKTQEQLTELYQDPYIWFDSQPVPAEGPIRLLCHYNHPKDLTYEDADKVQKALEWYAFHYAVGKLAREKGLDKDPGYIAAQARLDREIELERQRYIINTVMDKTPADNLDKDAQAMFHANPEPWRSPDLLQFKRLLLPGPEQARNAARRWQDGEDFSALLKELSLDPNKDIDHGITPYLDKESLGDDYAYLSGLQPGEVSRPVKTADGFAVYSLINRQKGGIPPYSSVSASVQNAVMVKRTADVLRAEASALGIKVEKFYNRLK